MVLYSHSRLATFEQCRLKYKFGYIDRIRREEESIEAFLGNRFHEAMEKLYGEQAFRTNTADDLKAFFADRWEKNFGPHIYVVKRGRCPEDYRAIGLKAIDDYWRRYAPFDAARTIGVERRLVADLDSGGRSKVQCYIDRIDVRPDGTLEIHDYKTSGTLPPQRALDVDRQLGLYELAVRQAWPDARGVELVWHYVAFDREMRSRRTEGELAALARDTASLIETIEICDDFPPTESGLCPYCAFQDICPLFAHLFRAELPPTDDPFAAEGVALVNRYTELEAKKRELRAEIERLEGEEEKIREAAIAVAERENVTRLFGRDHRLWIRSDIALHYPKSGEPGRATFERQMKESGLWERVADINYMALHGIARREHWLREVPPEFSTLLTIEPVKRVTLARRKDVDEEEGGGSHA